MADELAPGDETVPLDGTGSLVGDASAPEPSAFAADETVILPSDAELWRPGPRLAARGPGTPVRHSSRRGGSGWFIAALIIATAVVIALGIWFLVTSADDDSAVAAGAVLGALLSQ